MIAATIPDTTADVIARFDKAMARARRAVGEAKTAALMRQVYRLGADLKAHSDELVTKLEKGEAWLQAHGDDDPPHPQWQQREDQWLAWLKEYEAIMDALERGKDVL